MDYKSTLNLPRTDFPMKADLPKKEPEILKFWQDIDIYKLLCQRYKNNRKYILHDGPPYANGDIHIGHALNKTLKDIVVKFKTMQGYFSPFVPGWDCHGLPVEHQLFKELGITKSQISQVDFRKRAYDYAMKFVNIQKEQFKRLGVFGDWEKPYLTLDPRYEARILGSFGKLVRQGYIYKDLKPVNWCYECETALAEAEVEYEDHTSPSIYVKFEVINPETVFPIVSGQPKGANILRKPTGQSWKTSLSNKVYLLIWTTTPWTLLANVAIAVNPDFRYIGLVLENGDVLIVAEDLVDKIRINIGKTITFVNYNDTIREPIWPKPGRDLINLQYKHPFEFVSKIRTGTVVLADYVTKEGGTGCVHTAPGHGQEDYLTAKKYNLDMIMPVDRKGKFDNSAGEFSGLHVYDANAKIIEKLKKSGNLLYSDNLTHSYPHCWRCKNPIIFRATEQYFMSIDHKNLRKKLQDVIKKIKWIPKEGQDRISAMVESRPDWCLSRQRYWGVPIPGFYCKICKNKLILDADLIEDIAKLVGQKGSDIWFILEAKQLLPDNFKCPICKKDDFIKETDIIDVWFDSGVSHQAVLKQREELNYPADLYLEGSDQHRGWFQSALITAMGCEGSFCFKSVLTHGFVVDAEGRKMSKSLGNVISPQDIIKDFGADMLRLWVASSDYSSDVRISGEILSRLSEAYRKIRNTARFLLGNLFDFNPKTDKVSYNQMLEVDRWALSEAASMFESVTDYYESFEFYKVYRLIYDFCTIQMSNIYLDILKDRLYTYSADSIHRRSAQTAIYHILVILTKSVSPILTFTAEEIYKYMPKDSGDPQSAHLSNWPKIEKNWIDKNLKSNWDRLFYIRNGVLKVLEEKRIANAIGSPLEAGVKLFVKKSDAEFLNFLDKYKEQLNFIFIVSEIEILAVNELPQEIYRLEKNLLLKIPDFGIIADRAKGTKCARCWNYSTDVGKDTEFGDICPRCITALNQKRSDTAR